MKPVLKLVGVLLLLLAVAKILGMGYLALATDSEQEAAWYLKQSIYAGGCAAAGLALLSWRKEMRITGSPQDGTGDGDDAGT